jgi:DNA-binding IclR family transcriptional regulator
VLDKAVAVLAALEDGPRSLGELVDDSGLSRATAHRLASALEDHGLVRRDADGRFALGPRLLVLGRAAAETFPLGEAAEPALAELRDATGESVQLYVRDGDRRVCIAALESPHGLRTIVPLGASLTMEVGSAAKLLRGDADALRRGWAASVGEREAGVASVSAPVLDGTGRVLAAVSVSGPIERTTRHPGRRYADAVMSAARRIERDASLR